MERRGWTPQRSGEEGGAGGRGESALHSVVGVRPREAEKADTHPGLGCEPIPEIQSTGGQAAVQGSGGGCLAVSDFDGGGFSVDIAATQLQCLAGHSAITCWAGGGGGCHQNPAK